MKVLNKILEVILAVIVVIMVIGCFWQVVTRFILNNPSKYTEELLRYLLIWLTMLGVPYAYGKERHLSITLITKTFSDKGSLSTKIGTEILVILLSVAVFIIGGIRVTMNAAGQISPALQLPMEFYYICIPISGVLMIVYSVERLIRFIKQCKEGK
ncbi:MAG: TRAP transporter small permease [Lachnospiraceae bacterium]